MTQQQQHPITPPSELVQQWMTERKLIAELEGRVEALEGAICAPLEMTEHKATSGQWEALEEHSWQDAYSCILELRARMGALEDAKRAAQEEESNSQETLLMLLAYRIAGHFSTSRPGDDCVPFAKDVIIEIAAWLRKRSTRVSASVEIAGDLEREAER